MKVAALFVVMMLTFAFPAHATSNSSASQRLTAEGEENGPIPKKTLNDYYESCLYHIPDRFTPDARKYYCTCNTAAVQANFKMKDYMLLQRQSNRKPGNKLFEKYVHVAVAPCATDVPVQQIEYLACLLDTRNDPRVGNVMGYCTCVANKMVAHAMKFGEVEIMSRMAEDPAYFKEPVDALWSNQIYMTTKYKSRDECVVQRPQ